MPQFMGNRGRWACGRGDDEHATGKRKRAAQTAGLEETGGVVRRIHHKNREGPIGIVFQTLVMIEFADSTLQIVTGAHRPADTVAV